MAKKEVKESRIADKNIDLLIENSISVQRILASLAANLDSLSKDVRRMVEIFSEAGKSFEGRKSFGMSAESKALQSRLDNLVEQNKVMANSIILLESYLRGKSTAREEKEEDRLKKLPQYRF